MAQRAAVPKFGNWNAGEQDIGYTVYFENARKGRGGAQPSNPNDPQENPYLVSEETRSPPRTQGSHPRHNPRSPPYEPRNVGMANRVGNPPHEPRHNPGSPPYELRNTGMANRMGTPSHELRGLESSHRSPQELRTRADHGYHGRYPSSPGRKDNNADVRMHNSNLKPCIQGNPGRLNYGEFHQRAGKGSAGYEQSPHQHQGKGSSRGSVSSPTREGKGSYESSYGTPGRSRMKPVSPGNRNYDRGPALPKFGEWNTQNSSNSDGYTQIFTKAREEKQQRGVGMSPGKSPGRFFESPYNGPRKPARADEPMGGCCFPWGRK